MKIIERGKGMGGDLKLKNILLVEDNEDDVEITRMALSEAKLNQTLHVCIDGEEALDFLYNRNKFSCKDNNPRPDLILLDINMPKVNGLEVLKIVKQDDKLKHIPVIMLTTSQKDEDIIASYDSHANSFIQKPVDYDRFVEVIKGINAYWSSAIIPPE
jgi:CheY-like chemotaxis protein